MIAEKRRETPTSSKSLRAGAEIPLIEQYRILPQVDRELLCWYSGGVRKVKARLQKPDGTGELTDVLQKFADRCCNPDGTLTGEARHELTQVVGSHSTKAWEMYEWVKQKDIFKNPDLVDREERDLPPQKKLDEAVNADFELHDEVARLKHQAESVSRRNVFPRIEGFIREQASLGTITLPEK